MQTSTTATAGAHRAPHADLGVLLEALRAGDALAVFQKLGEAAVDVAVQNRLLVVAVLGQTLDLFPFDRKARSSLSTPWRLKTRTSTMVPCTPGGTRSEVSPNVGRLFAENGAQKLLFRRHRALALRRDLADQDVAGTHFRADVDDAGFVEVFSASSETFECRG